jgi:hypothetical protein
MSSIRYIVYSKVTLYTTFMYLGPSIIYMIMVHSVSFRLCVAFGYAYYGKYTNIVMTINTLVVSGKLVV